MQIRQANMQTGWCDLSREAVFTPVFAAGAHLHLHSSDFLKIFFQYFKCLKSKKMFNSEQKNTVTAPPEYQNTEIRINNSLSINLPSFSQSIVKEFCQKNVWK